MRPKEIATVVSAVGNHDEEVGSPINPVSAVICLNLIPIK